MLLHASLCCCRTVLAKKDVNGLASLMDRNFDLRLSMFSEAALGEANLDMVSMAHSVGGETLSYLHNHMGQVPAANASRMYQLHSLSACTTCMHQLHVTSCKYHLHVTTCMHHLHAPHLHVTLHVHAGSS